MAHPGEVLDNRYELIELIGPGGMGEVWTAKQLSLDGKIVAVKVLRNEFTRDEENIERFKREAKILANLGSHPNLVSVRDYGESLDSFGVQLYIVMDYIKGSNLAKLIKANKTEDDRWKIQVLADIADALHTVHQLNIIHRDIKPDNIMISSEDHAARLTDFGIALSSNYASNPLTREHNFIGTPEFSSPEQLIGANLTPASDVYSLAIVGYMLFSGENPFPGQRQDSARMRLSKDPNPLPENVPTDVSSLLAGILSVSNPRRIEGADEFARQLRACNLQSKKEEPTKTIYRGPGSPDGPTNTFPHPPPTIRDVINDFWSDLDLHGRFLKLGEGLHNGNVTVIAAFTALSVTLGICTGLIGFFIVSLILTI